MNKLKKLSNPKVVCKGISTNDNGIQKSWIHCYNYWQNNFAGIFKDMKSFYGVKIKNYHSSIVDNFTRYLNIILIVRSKKWNC